MLTEAINPINIQQLRQSLKLKWVSYYYKNRLWLIKMRIWGTYDGQRRPNSGFILATLSVLEPQLDQILPFILELNNNPDQIVRALGLNFNPEEHENLTKSDDPMAADQVPSESPQETQANHKPMSACIATGVESNTTVPSVAVSTQVERESPVPTLPNSKPSADIATQVESKGESVLSVAVSTHVKRESPVPTLPHGKPSSGFATQVKSKNKFVGSVAVATKVENNSKAMPLVATATKVESNSKAMPLVVLTTQVHREPPPPMLPNRKPLAAGIATSVESNSKPMRLVVDATTNVESKDKLIATPQQDIVKPSPASSASKLASWIDDFCQGAGWDREEAIFIPSIFNKDRTWDSQSVALNRCGYTPKPTHKSSYD